MNKKTKFVTRYGLQSDGKIKEIKVKREDSEKAIDNLLKRDKEMLDILEKL